LSTELRQLAGCLDVETWNRLGAGHLPGLIDMRIVEVAPERLASRLEVRTELMAPNGFLHAATIVALADTTCGSVSPPSSSRATSSAPRATAPSTALPRRCTAAARRRSGTPRSRAPSTADRSPRSAARR
jgi:hypothetical protein